MMILDLKLIQFNENKQTSVRRRDNLDRIDNLVSVMCYELIWKKLPSGLPDNTITSDDIRKHIADLRAMIDRLEFKLNKSNLYNYHTYLQIVLYLKTKMLEKFNEMHHLSEFARSLAEHFGQRSKAEYHLGKALEEAASEDDRAYITSEYDRIMKIFAQELVELSNKECAELLPKGAEYQSFINKMMAEVKKNMGHKS